MNRVENQESGETLMSLDLEAVLSELSHYREQSRRLARVNELYRQLAGIVDLATMIESYSIWLAQYVPHDLIGYHNTGRQRMHLFCSCHGPERRRIIRIAEHILREPEDMISHSLPLEGFFSHTWLFESPECSGLLILLRRHDEIRPSERELIQDSLDILAEPLKRALDYEDAFQQARIDALTGLPNRLDFSERIPAMIERAKRHAYPLTLAALDLDHFKNINDTLGHLTGDQVLKRVAKTLQDQIRMSDLLVRTGGDEFLLVLPDTDLQAARNLGDRLCQAVEQLDITTGGKRLGVSIGIVQWQPTMSCEQWLELADDALYRAKAEGRSRVAQAPLTVCAGGTARNGVAARAATL